MVHGETAQRPAGREVMLTFGALLLSMLLASLDQTIVATALPTIAGDLGGLQSLSWVVTAYLLATTATTPLWGKIGDLYGRKRIMGLAILVFLGGSALCGAAWNMTALIVFRALQGVGAGGLIVMAMAIVGDIFSPRERGRYQGYIQAVFALASVAGPVVGGLFVDHLSWRWVFAVNLPLGAVALSVIGLTVRAPARRTEHHVDYLGAALLVAAVCSLLLVTVLGGKQYGWISPQILGLALAFVLLTAAFLWSQQRAAEPVLPLTLFGNPVIVVVDVVLFLATCCFFAANVFLPLYLQVVKHAAATSAGLLLLPMLLSIMAATTVSGRLVSRTGRYKVFPVVGAALVALAMYLFAQLDTGTGQFTASALMIVMGLGYGLITQILVVAVQNVVPREQLGTATASTNFFRSLGGSVGVAVFGTVFSTALTGALRRTVPTGSAGPVSGQALLSSPGRLARLPEPARSAVAEAVANSLHAVFLTALPIAAVAFVVVLFLREVPLRQNRPSGAAPPGPGARPAAGSSQDS
jgi:EmrB/QacA subfamily drug resistance transporter